ncbi:hypothetical protein PMAYCL1PPCAC_06980, partial [Pristionchus mayeri]
ATQPSFIESAISKMAGDNDWNEPPARPVMSSIYDVEAADTHRPNRSRYEGRNRQRTRPNESANAARLYDAIARSQGINAEGATSSIGGYYQNMGELNYPADEQFRKEGQITKNRLDRDRYMKMKKKASETKRLNILDTSSDEFVIPCKFPSAKNVPEKKEEHISRPPSFSKIEEFLKMPRPANRWADAIDGEGSGEGHFSPRRNEDIESLIIAHAVQAASQLENCSYSISLSFEDVPPVFEKRKSMLKTIVIDGCAVMKQINFNFEVPWSPSGGATNTFKGNKLLVMKPLIELAMRFILQGHKTVIILPSYYMIPVFAGVRQKVDDLAAFDTLVKSRIVQFIEEEAIEAMHRKLLEENEKYDGTWVSTSDLERIILSYKRELRQRAGERSTIEDKNDENSIADVSNRLTPFFYDNKTVLSLHTSTKEKKILHRDQLMCHEEENMERLEERSNSQMTMEEQMKILVALQDLFDLPLRLLRAYMLYRRILKEMEENEEEKRKIENEMAVKDLEDETRRAFEMDDYEDRDLPNVTRN